MGSEKKANVPLIVFTVLIGISFWGITLYNGWLNEVVLFGHNVINGWFDKTTPGISANENVTTVKQGEFAYKLLDNIDIPDNITTIKDSAFRGNKLTSVTIPPSVTSIGKKAFDMNRLTSITIGENVALAGNSFGLGFEEIYKNNGLGAGTYTLINNENYEWSIWSDNYGYIIDNGSITITGYSGTDSEMEIPAEINGNPVKIIGERAFYKNPFTSVVIPDSVTVIGDSAFLGDWDNSKRAPLGAISSVTFGNSVISIGNKAFENNKLSRITLPDSVTSIGYSAFADNPVTRLSIGADVTLETDGSFGILGEGTGFNTAYSNNSNKAGIYTRPNARSGTWRRAQR